MTEPKSDTPRTDDETDDARNFALDFECRSHPKETDEPPLVVPAAFARLLEKELTAKGADEIERLKQENANLLAANKDNMNWFNAAIARAEKAESASEANPWVSVKIRTPIKDGWYTGFYERKIMSDCLLIDRRFPEDVTHWWDEEIMQIPRPKEGGMSKKHLSRAPHNISVVGWLRGYEFISLPEHIRTGDVPVFTIGTPHAHGKCIERVREEALVAFAKRSISFMGLSALHVSAANQSVMREIYEQGKKALAAYEKEEVK